MSAIDILMGSRLQKRTSAWHKPARTPHDGQDVWIRPDCAL